jgi:PAS domain S-box-containing protein
MTDSISITRQALVELEERSRTLAREKSYLQLLIRLMSRMSATPGLENTIESMLRNIIDVVGGTNVMLYYMMDGRNFYWDVYGRREQVETIADEVVRKVVATHQAVEMEHDFSDTRMISAEFGKAYTWVYPLLVGHDLVGVFKMENLHMGMRDLYAKLPLFFNYAALILKNEIQSQSKLRQAYDQLSASNAELAREIQERRLVESALLRQDKFIRSLLENIPDGVVACDAGGILNLFNRAARQWHGLDPMALPPEQWAEHYDLFAGDGKTPLSVQTVPLARAYRGEEVRNTEMSIVAKGQPPRYILANAGPFFDEQGQMLGAVAVMVDITERRRVEDEVRQLNRNLQERAAALEAANKELEAFAYTVSHDLRAPLRHIEGFLELLRKSAKEPLDEQSCCYMDAVSQSVLRMGDLIDDLLAFSRVGRNQMARLPVNLAGLIQEVIRESKPETATREIEWRIGDLPSVTGDQAMLRIVLVNLISNALKFTRLRPQAQIEVGSIPGQASEAVIFVRDNGVGFDMQYADKLFGVFQRLHRAEEFMGTGIGLATVHRIIERHGGRTWAEGEPDQGAVFYFTLPQVRRGEGHDSHESGKNRGS